MLAQAAKATIKLLRQLNHSERRAKHIFRMICIAERAHINPNSLNEEEALRDIEDAVSYLRAHGIE